MNKKNIIKVVVVLVVVLAAFYGGTLYGKNHQNKFPARNQPGFMGMRNGDRAFGMGMASFISGQIISKDDKSVTIKLPNGGSKIVFFDTNTKVLKYIPGAVTDLAIGTDITVTGTPNSDGSLNASSLQIRPTPSTSVVQ